MLPVNVDQYKGDPATLTWRIQGIGRRRDGSPVFAGFEGRRDYGCGFPTVEAYSDARNVQEFANGAEPEGNLSLLPNEIVQELRTRTQGALSRSY